VLVTLAVLSNVLVTLSALSGANAQIQGRQPEALDWQRSWFRSSERRSNIPPASSRPGREGGEGNWTALQQCDGRSLLTIYTRENEAGDTPASYLKNNLRVGRSALDDERGHAILLRDLLDPPGAHLLQPV